MPARGLALNPAVPPSFAYSKKALFLPATEKKLGRLETRLLEGMVYCYNGAAKCYDTDADTCYGAL